MSTVSLETFDTLKPYHFALLFNSKIIAAQDTPCPYQWKCTDSLISHFLIFGERLDHLTSDNPEHRSRAAAEVVSWGTATDRFGHARNLQLFKDLFGLDPDKLWADWACGIATGG